MAEHEVEHLPIGELHRRADCGDPAAAAVLEAWDQRCAKLAAGAAAALNAPFAQIAKHAGAQLAGPAGEMAGSGPIGISKKLADLVRGLDQRDALLARRMARLRDRILGRPRHRRFVSHSPFRVSR